MKEASELVQLQLHMGQVTVSAPTAGQGQQSPRHNGCCPRRCAQQNSSLCVIVAQQQQWTLLPTALSCANLGWLHRRQATACLENPHSQTLNNHTGSQSTMTALTKQGALFSAFAVENNAVVAAPSLAAHKSRNTARNQLNATTPFSTLAQNPNQEINCSGLACHLAC